MLSSVRVKVKEVIIPRSGILRIINMIMPSLRQNEYYTKMNITLFNEPKIEVSFRHRLASGQNHQK